MMAQSHSTCVERECHDKAISWKDEGGKPVQKGMELKSLQGKTKTGLRQRFPTWHTLRT